MSEITHVYIGVREPCGCTRAIVCDDPEHVSHTADFVAGIINSGLVAVRVPVADGQHRIAQRGCEACQARAKKWAS